MRQAAVEVAVMSQQRFRGTSQTWNIDGQKIRAFSAKSMDELDRIITKRHVSVVVLDTDVQTSAGGFDAVDAIQWMKTRTSPLQTLLWVDPTESSLHMAEEAAIRFRGLRLEKDLLNAACQSWDCMAEATACVQSGLQWVDQHLRKDLLVERPVLYAELQARNVAPAMMLSAAVRPEPWSRLAKTLGFSQKYLRTALNQCVAPVTRRIEWIGERESLTSQKLIGLVNRRTDYMKRYIMKHLKMSDPHLYRALVEVPDGASFWWPDLWPN